MFLEESEKFSRDYPHLAESIRALDRHLEQRAPLGELWLNATTISRTLQIPLEHAPQILRLYEFHLEQVEPIYVIRCPQCGDIVSSVAERPANSERYQCDECGEGFTGDDSGLRVAYIFRFDERQGEGGRPANPTWAGR